MTTASLLVLAFSKSPLLTAYVYHLSRRKIALFWIRVKLAFGAYDVQLLNGSAFGLPG